MEFPGYILIALAIVGLAEAIYLAWTGRTYSLNIFEFDVKNPVEGYCSSRNNTPHERNTFDQRNAARLRTKGFLL